MSKVVVYCRVSTENQEAEGTSLETQERACQHKAKELLQQGDEVVMFREVASGLSLERPMLPSIREMIRTGQARAMVVYAADRLARDGLHLLLLVDEMEKAGVQLVFVTEPHESTPEGQLLTFVRGWASKLEALKIKERTVRGRKERNKKGLLPTGGLLYGYLYMKGKGEHRGIRIPDQDKASIVRDIFSWYVQDGLSLEQMKKRLYALGIPSPKGKPAWSSTGLRKMLRNPAYKGLSVTHWRAFGFETIEAEGATPALVEARLWEAAQERLRLNKETRRRYAKYDYALRGVLFCGACGERMTGYSNGERRYYRCRHYRVDIGQRKRCPTTIPADPLEREVWEAVKRVLSKPSLVREQTMKYSDHSVVAELKQKLSTTEHRLDSLVQGEESIVRMLRRGVITEETAEAQLKESRGERELLYRELANLRGQVEAALSWEKLDLNALCSKALQTLEAPTQDIQHLAYQALGARVAVKGKTHIAITLNLPFESSLLGTTPRTSPYPPPESHPPLTGYGR